MMRVSCEVIERFAKRAFLYVGIPEEDAAQAAQVVAQADRSGVYSHGLQRLPMYLTRVADGAVNKAPHLHRTDGGGLCMAFDGENGLGIVNGPRVMDAVIEAAREQGIAAATLRNSNHYGAGNYYGWKAAKAGVIGICMTNTSPCMAPTGGAEKLLGTNPLTVAFPAGEADPVVLDMATSVVSYGKLQVSAGKGEPIPEGWAIDAEGKGTTDPREALKGSLLPIGGYKGLRTGADHRFVLGGAERGLLWPRHRTAGRAGLHTAGGDRAVLPCHRSQAVFAGGGVFCPYGWVYPDDQDVPAGAGSGADLASGGDRI